MKLYMLSTLAHGALLSMSYNMVATTLAIMPMPGRCACSRGFFPSLNPAGIREATFASSRDNKAATALMQEVYLTRVEGRSGFRTCT